MDLTDTIAPKSDQLDAVDLLAGPRTFTIERVTEGNEEQPVNIHFAEFPRPWRPGKSMRRALVRCWGPDTVKYGGRRVKLYCDVEVRFGGQAVGGIRIAALSHIDKPMHVPLLVSRGKSAVFVVQPLADVHTSPAVSAETLAELAAMFERKGVPEGSQLSGVNRIIDGSATDLECITQDEARKVLAVLDSRPDAVLNQDGTGS